MSLFNSGGGKAAKFPQIGATITGKIAQMPFEKQATEFGTNRPATWPNGDPKLDVVVPLTETNAPREDGNDDGDRTIYVSSGKMKRAIANAIQAAGADDVAVGGLLTVTYVADDPNSKNPANPAKLYEASYTPPASGLAAPPAAAQALQQVAPQQPVQQPAQPAAAAPQAVPQPQAAPAAVSQHELAGVSAEVYAQAKQLLALNTLSREQAAAALGITPEQIDTIAGTPF